jgi:mRNA-capping enzyme
MTAGMPCDQSDTPPGKQCNPSYGPAEAIAMAKQNTGRNVDMVIDLTNSSRYYDPREAFESKGVKYLKVACVGKDAPPDAVAVTQFVHAVGKYMVGLSLPGGVRLGTRTDHTGCHKLLF